MVPDTVTEHYERRHEKWLLYQQLMKSPMSHLTDAGLLNTYPAKAEDTFSMKLYLLPGIATHDFIARFLDGKFKTTHDNLDISDAVNTLIAYIPMAQI